ncbi:sulfate transporter family-domain-containing protein [Hypoxylon rubiginosum]|uniref:Sulfate transporter family-domain-containing protein n=1 Tax=Hypoxylon rubiginosum TaxID=110542 RepID=A0ACC0D515_9PEZI|nr:sulfate transporter family-domain-containing protein [Hypoxylon rubiginosum]
MPSSRPPSINAGSRPYAHDHAPLTPSGLRQSRTVSSSSMSDDMTGDAAGPSTRHDTPIDEITENTSLLHHERVHDGSCDHGTFSPRVSSPPPTTANLDTETGSTAESEGSVPTSETQLKNWRKAFSSRVKSKKMTDSSNLAHQHGVKDSWKMYLFYYIPFFIWIKQYRWSWLKGDITAAITIASMYLPMALSYADNLAHVPPINGLYAFAINPFIYALLGSCPLMVVGPEAAGSLLIGSIVKNSIDLGRGEEDNTILQAQVAGVAVGIAGATVFLMGVFRLGFLDSVLSRPFLRGFISAIGVVIFIDQLIPVLGLHHAATSAPGVTHGSTVEKLEFVLTHLGDRHKLTAIIGVVGFAVIMVLREIKRRLQPRYPSVAYFPDRLIVVVLSAVFAWSFDWEGQGVAVLGKVEAASGHIFAFRNPFQLSHMTHIRDAMGTSFLIGMLGFFESSVAAKSLGGEEIVEGMQLSPNRELVALGAANLCGACFMAIPAFGGYGRSKVNKSTGGKSPMSSIILSIITVICIVFLLPWFYYIPKPVLSALIMTVAWSLIEEAPHDISFFVRIKGWTELALMAVILAVTVFFSLNLGIAIGIGLSLLQVIRHATRPRIQILGRIPNSDRFANAEEHPENLEFVEGCLIVKIPEPLTFANTGELKNRLRRLELYGTGNAHPALPRLRSQASNRNIIFDIHGVTSMDGSGTQVLEEIVRSYRDRGVRVFFSRPVSRQNKVWELMERSGIVELVGGKNRFVDDVKDALRMTEVEDFEGAGACAAASDELS